MSYKDKPQIKLYKYINGSFVMQAQIDDFQEVSFEHNIYEAGTFTITINYNIPNALLFERGLFCQFGNNPYDFGEIITIQDTIGQDGKGSQIRTITGYDARYILKRRVIKNMNSNGLWVMTDKGEIVLRSLVQDQCGTNAETKRQLPISNTIPASSDAIGKEYAVSEQFTNLYEVCKTIATQSEIGWRMAFDGSGLSLEVFEGTDLSQTVRFDTSYESLANGNFTDSSDSFSNAIYIGGKGQNDNRDIYEGEDGTPEGLDRFESWDNQSSMTSEDEYEAEAVSMLTQYGQTLMMSGNGLAKCPYIFREQYDIGDIITVAFSGKSAKAQILSITERWLWGVYDIQFSFGKPQPTQSDQLQLMLRKIQEASNKTNAIDSIRWYTIPTDTAMPKADVTYDTIGFTGTMTADKTFTLYLDDENTGSKNYNFYTKNLSGNYTLTLTTGRSGATNFTIKGGSNITGRIYIDEDGNITPQGMTATDTIASGSTQPATSGGVASAISSEASARDTAIANAIDNRLGGIQYLFTQGTSTGSYSYFKIEGLIQNMSAKTSTFLLQSRGGELYLISQSSDDNYLVIPKIKRLFGVYKKIQTFSYSGTTVYMRLNAWANLLSLTQIAGLTKMNVTISTATQQEYEAGTQIEIEDVMSTENSSLLAGSKIKTATVNKSRSIFQNAQYGYVQIDGFPTEITETNVIGFTFVSGGIADGNGLQITYGGGSNGTHYFWYYIPNTTNFSYTRSINFTISYIV